MLSNFEKFKCVAAGLAAALLFSLFLNAMAEALIRPDVHISNSTGECVRVLNYTKDYNYTCVNLPSKYNKVWVK
jgi:hypothetical protein